MRVNHSSHDTEGLEAKGPFSFLGLQVIMKRAYQISINFSILWLVKYYLNYSNYYLNIMLSIIWFS